MNPIFNFKRFIELLNDDLKMTMKTLCRRQECRDREISWKSTGLNYCPRLR